MEDITKLLASNKLSAKEKKKIIVKEFLKCKEDFFYFVENHVRIRHPNTQETIPAKLFDYQIDIARPIVLGLQYGRNKKTIELLKKTKNKFDFKKWYKEYIEKKYVELKERIPYELEEYYRLIVDNPIQKTTIDKIILKSRQTGISTLFQLISLWHINFYPNKYHITVSFRDKDSMKYLKDIKNMYASLPSFLRCKTKKNNDHELELIVPGITKKDGIIKITKNQEMRSRIFSQTASEIRGDPPNLLVLDEFASYQDSEKLWESAGFSVSGGGIIVIISTPKGINNLYYQLWKSTKNTIINVPDDIKNTYSGFGLGVIHWTQMPDVEFKRRGFEKPIDWYNWISQKYKLEGGSKKVAQELDLEFISSGDTFIEGSVIKKYEVEKNVLEITSQYKKHKDNYIIYEKPQKNVEYMLSCDVAKGVGKDFSVVYVLRKENEHIPKICLEYKSNKIKPDELENIIYNIYRYYGKKRTWINIEQNNHGLTVISNLLNNKDFDENRILNPFNFKKNTFKDDFKGFETDKTSRDILLFYFKEVIENINPPITQALFNEIKNFLIYEKKIEAKGKYHDDHIIAYSIGIFSLFKLLPFYKNFLKSKGKISVDLNVYSSSFIEPENNLDVISKPEKIKLKHNKEQNKIKYNFTSQGYKTENDDFFVF